MCSIVSGIGQRLCPTKRHHCSENADEQIQDECGIRVPAIISYPAALPENVVRAQAVTLADFYPTVLELCALPLPGCKLDGRSLMPIIKSANAPTHQKVMHWQWQNTWAVREGDWKLIYNGRDTTGVKSPGFFLAVLPVTSRS